MVQALSASELRMLGIRGLLCSISSKLICMLLNHLANKQKPFWEIKLVSFGLRRIIWRVPVSLILHFSPMELVSFVIAGYERVERDKQVVINKLNECNPLLSESNTQSFARQVRGHIVLLTTSCRINSRRAWLSRMRICRPKRSRRELCKAIRNNGLRSITNEMR